MLKYLDKNRNTLFIHIEGVLFRYKSLQDIDFDDFETIEFDSQSSSLLSSLIDEHNFQVILFSRFSDKFYDENDWEANS